MIKIRLQFFALFVSLTKLANDKFFKNVLKVKALLAKALSWVKTQVI